MTALLLATALLTSQTPGYNRLRAQSDDPDPHCLWWRSPALTLHFQQDGSADLTRAQTFAVARRSMGSWQAAMASCSALTLGEGGEVASREVAFHSDAPETTQNILVFRTRGACRDVVPADAPCRKVSLYECANVHDCWPHQAGALAVTSSFHDPNTGELLDADIEFNDARFQFTGTEATGPTCTSSSFEDCVYYDLENTLTHELGHFVGLDHINQAGSTMHPSADIGDTDKRTVDPASAQFVCDAYPVGEYPRDCVLDRIEPELGPASCAVTPAAPFGAAVWALLLAGRRRRS